MSEMWVEAVHCNDRDLCHHPDFALSKRNYTQGKKKVLP
jgi:hypothetical protein